MQAVKYLLLFSLHGHCHPLSAVSLQVLFSFYRGFLRWLERPSLHPTPLFPAFPLFAVLEIEARISNVASQELNPCPMPLEYYGHYVVLFNGGVVLSVSHEYLH